MKKNLKSFALASLIILNLVSTTNGFNSWRKINELSQADPINPRPEIITQLSFENDPINPRPEVISNIFCNNDPINPKPEIITEFYCVNDPINPRPEISTLFFS